VIIPIRYTYRTRQTIRLDLIIDLSQVWGGSKIIGRTPWLNVRHAPSTAKGGGAYGELVITPDISTCTKAKAPQTGAKASMIIRFWTVAGERGAADAQRGVRGFALPDVVIVPHGTTRR